MRRRTDFMRYLICIVICTVMTLLCVPVFRMQTTAAYAVDGDSQISGSVTEENTETDEFGTGGMDESASVPGRSGSGSKLRSRSALPDKYDSREKGYVTPVRDQGFLDICWSFGTIAAIESSILAHGQVSSPNDLDLSERQLAYFSYNLVPDQLGNTAGDENIPIRSGYSNYIQNYGNAWLTTEVMASGIGIAKETDAPSVQELKNKWLNEGQVWSEEFNNDTKLDSGLARGANSWRLNSVRRIPVSDANSIKQAIMEDGGVAVLTNLSTSNYTGASTWNYRTSAYYNYSLTDSNHLICIVGWDDNYDKNNFALPDDDDFSYLGESKLPENNGAWLCKNSYGPRWGEDGYYWLSYEDCYFAQGGVAAYAFEVVQASGSEIMYQYDGAAGECFNRIQSGGSIANMFTVKGTDSEDETLQSVCLTMLNDTDVSYSIQIYTDCTDDSDPTSGKPALSSPQEGTTGFGGFYTIPLDKPVTLKNGSKFAVVVTLSHSDGSQVKYDVDANWKNGNWLQHVSAVSPNQSFERDTADSSWDDLSSNTHDNKDEPACAARVKAITAAHAHSWDSGVVTTEPTCTGKGVKTFKCGGCNAEKTEEIDALGHDWDDGTITKDPTYEEEGTKEYTCKRDGCGEKRTESIGKLEHVYSDEWTVDDDYHWHECTHDNCSAIDSKGGHDWIEAITREPSCTEKGEKTFTCSVCGATKTEEIDIDTAAHTWNNDYTVDREATCNEDGLKSIHCSQCDAVKENSSAAIPKGHSWGYWQRTKDPTQTAAGTDTRICSKCRSQETRSVEMLPRLLLSRTSFTWNNKVQTPKVTVKAGNRTLPASCYTVSYPKGRKNIGVYTIKITLKNGYSGTRSASYTIVPKGSKLTGASAARRAVTVKWSRQTAKMPKARINGYQIQYSMRKDFKSGNKAVNTGGYSKNSRKISGLKSKKTYYFRVRTYMKSGKKNYYSGWSNVKAVKVK